MLGKNKYKYYCSCTTTRDPLSDHRMDALFSDVSAMKALYKKLLKLFMFQDLTPKYQSPFSGWFMIHYYIY